MEKNQTKVAGNTVTRNLSDLAEPTGNIYESVMVIAPDCCRCKAGVERQIGGVLKFR